MVEPSAEKTGSSTLKHNVIWFALSGVIIVGLIFMIGAWMKKSGETTLEIGKPAPNFTLTSFSGDSYMLSELKGRVVLINIWASWCFTCDEESNMLQEVWEEIEPTGEFLFLGVDYVDTEKPALEFIQSHGLTYPNGPDLGSDISKLYKVNGVPETFLVDKEGVLRAIQIGPFTSSDDVRRFLAQAGE